MPLLPGTIVAVTIGPVRHIGIVSGNTVAGEPLVISSSHRRGMVCEEPISTFLDGGKLLVAQRSGNPATFTALSRARSQLGRPWNLFTANCEHFVTFALGQEQRSPQLQMGVSLAALVLGIRILSTR